MPEKPLDFDYQSTTPCSPLVLKAMEPYWEAFWGNPSNRQNRAGIYASAAISNARETLASILGVSPELVVFTSGATESNNLALLGHARAEALKNGKPGHLITLKTEHNSILDPILQLHREGFSVTQLSTKSDGLIDLEKLEDAFEDDTFMVSIMAANNEIGVIQPIPKIASLCSKYGASLHSDGAQAFGHLPIKLDRLGVDLFSLSGHKIYGPKGIGALIINKDMPIQPLLWGGDQEQNLRPGTIPVPLVIGLAKAAEIAYKEQKENSLKLSSLRNQLWNGLKKDIPDLLLNGSLIERLPHNLNFTVLRVNGRKLHKELRRFINCSSSSACSNGSPSHVLRALGRNSIEAESSLRLSLGRETTMEEINKAISIISEVIKQLRC
ncbi:MULTISPECIES: cysteine desulfurase family protein [Prochlorococcus]|uniref:cysteine desulfurase family protein n=1 Tax=Prochlorococcus TaxID=1218 RepID=UPI0005339FA7|nr:MULTISPECIES: cysteine desulfurase family protein [Prochlorococcus]KGG13202.1 Cysteine desulfurase [Prochlorococcus sp. MIT 0601]